MISVVWSPYDPSEARVGDRYPDRTPLKSSEITPNPVRGQVRLGTAAGEDGGAGEGTAVGGEGTAAATAGEGGEV